MASRLGTGLRYASRPMVTDTPLSHIPIFRSLEPEALGALAAIMTRQAVPANEMVFWIGDPAGPLYVVDSGQVAITAPDEDGEHVLLETVGPGGVFGEISFLDGGPRSATARAVTDTVLLVLPREAFHDFLLQRPDVSIGILQIMGARQRASTATIRGLKNPNAVIAETATIWQRVSDIIASVAASQAFTIVHVAWFGCWILLNVTASAGLLPASLAFDPYPFGLLTLIVSLEAIFLSIFVLVSQNRQAERDRIRTDLDHHVNVKAHLELINIVQRLERIEHAVKEERAQ